MPRKRRPVRPGPVGPGPVAPGPAGPGTGPIGPGPVGPGPVGPGPVGNRPRRPAPTETARTHADKGYRARPQLARSLSCFCRTNCRAPPRKAHRSAVADKSRKSLGAVRSFEGSNPSASVSAQKPFDSSGLVGCLVSGRPTPLLSVLSTLTLPPVCAATLPRTPRRVKVPRGHGRAAAGGGADA